MTKRERQVAALAAEGATNAEIGGALGIAQRTVEWNLTRVYRKLGVRSRTELARRLPVDSPWVQREVSLGRADLVTSRDRRDALLEDDSKGDN